MASFKKEFDFAKELAIEAGGIMRRYFRAEDIGVQWKEDSSPVTVADLAINDLVIEKVKNHFPDHGVIGEEASLDVLGKYVWVVDPIDGTIPFSISIPVSTFSLALVDREDGQPVVAVAYDPQLDHLYSAMKGHKTSFNDISVKASSKLDLKDAYISVIGSFNEDASFHEGNLVRAARDKWNARSFNLLSQVYAATKVASGELAASIFRYGSPWDSAAAALLVIEAGGVVTDFEGKTRRYDDWGNGCILSANQSVHDEVLSLVNASRV